MGAELEALAKLVATLREAGVATYEGPVPGWRDLGLEPPVKLTVRPPAPPKPPEQPRRKASDEEQETPVVPTPAGMGWRY